MSDPTSDLEAWAAAYRAQRRPSPARKRAIVAGVLEGAAAQDRQIRRQRWLGVGVLLAAGVLGALALGRLIEGRTMRAGADDAGALAPHTAPAEQVHEVREGEVAAQRGGGSESSAPVVPAGEADAAETVVVPTTTGEAGAPSSVTPTTKPAARGASERGRAAEPAPATAPAAVPSTDDELESMRLLRDAERRLETDAADSLRLLERHEQRFPSSSLALEREALTVIALCRLGRVEAGRERQQAFLRRPGSSAYAARVKGACEAAR